MKIAIALYIFGIVIGVYAVWNNIPPLLNISFVDPTVAFARILIHLIAVGVGFFLIYTGILNIKELLEKERSKKQGA